MMKAIVFAIVSALAASASAEPGYIDAFVNPDFEDSAFHGSLDKHTEAGRGFGYNGNGGAHVSGFMRHSFVLPVKKGLRLSKGRRYVFSLDVKNNSRNSDVIEQIAFEVYDAKTGKYDHGYWGRTEQDIGGGWHRETLSFVPKRDLSAEADSLRFILFVQVDPRRNPPIKHNPAEHTVDCDNARLAEDAPVWHFFNTWPTHNRVHSETGRVRAYSAFVGKFLPDGARPTYRLSLKTQDGRVVASAEADERDGVVEAVFGPLKHEGPALLCAELLDCGNRLGERVREVTVGPAYRPKKGEAVIDEKGRVMVDGRPFMAVGLYTNFADHRKHKPEELEAHFRKMHDAGFNFMIDYGTYLLNTKERRGRYYGLCEKYGIRVLADDFAGLQQRTNEIATCSEKAKALAAYPAVIGWYTMDEASEDKIPVLERIRRALNKATPGHLVLTCNIMAPAPYLGTADVQGGDKYPIDAGKDGKPATLADAEAYMAKCAACRPAAAWHAPQAVNWANYRRGAMQDRETYLKSGREPEENEMLSVALAYASHGVTGFTFYSYFDVFRGPFPEWYDLRWKKLCGVVAAMKSLEPFIMSGHGVRELKHQDRRDRTRVVALSDGKGDHRILVIGLGADHEAVIELAQKSRRFSSRCGNTVFTNGKYIFKGKEFTCDILQ